MKDKIVPLPCIRQLQYQKYKTAMIPILIIMLGFVLQLSRVVVPFNSIIMSLSLVSYLAVLYLYRMGNPTIPDLDNIIVSPIHGKVISVEKANGTVKIQIAKSFFDPVELRCPLDMSDKADDSEIMISYGGDQVEMSFGNKHPFWFHEPGTVMGSLLGLVFGSHHVMIKLNENLLSAPIRIKKDDILVAGQTILAELKNPVAVSL